MRVEAMSSEGGVLLAMALPSFLALLKCFDNIRMRRPASALTL